MIGEFTICSVLIAADLAIVPAGAGGGLTASVATCPLDVVKTKLQAQRAAHGDAAYRGVFGE